MHLFRKSFLFSILLLLLTGSSVFVSAATLNTTGLIPQGVTIKGIPVGGLSPAEAALELQSSLPSPDKENLVIADAGKSYTIKLPEIEAIYDYLSSADDALSCFYKGNYISQLITVLQLQGKPVDMALKISFSKEKVEEKVVNIQKEWETPFVDAAVTLSEGKVTIIPEKEGYQLDFEKTLERTFSALSEGNLNVAAVGRFIKPNITSDDLAGINSMLAEYSTTFDASAVNRSHNIALASETLNGCLLKPGEIFSLNKRLGPRLATTGYLQAPVFVGNYLALDVGGGICQVATTLYNAAILADLPVIERHPHPLPVSYAAPGLDATIAGDYLDLKFVNNTDAPVYISSLVENDTITINIYGVEKDDDSNIRITSEKHVIDPEVVIIEDYSMPEGAIEEISSGSPGYELRVYKEVLKNDEVVSKELISSDYSASEDRVIRVNPLPNDEEK